MAGEQKGLPPSSGADGPRAAPEERDTAFAETASAGEIDLLSSLTSLLAAPQSKDELGRLGTTAS